MGDKVDLNDIAEPNLPSGDPQPARPFRSILIGAQTLLTECAQILQQNRHEILAIVAPPGAAADWAASVGLRHFAHSRELLAAGIGPVDYVFSITNLAVLPCEVLALAQRAAINFHDGPLPEYAGLNTPVWALLAGERRHGITWHLMTDNVDSGDILMRETIAIEPGETALSLNTKCFEAGLRSFPRLVSALAAGALVRHAQPPRPLRWFGASDRPSAAATVDWNCSAEAIARLVSALDHGGYRNPLGIPKVLIGDRLHLVHEVQELETTSDFPPGTVIVGGSSPVVATGTSDLRLTRISDLGGQPVSHSAVVPGELLSSLSEEQRIGLGALDSAASRHESWWHARLRAHDALQLPQFRTKPLLVGEGHVASDHLVPGDFTSRNIITALIAYLGRVADRSEVDLGYSDQIHLSRLEGFRPWFIEQLPLRAKLDWNASLAQLEREITVEIAEMHRRIGCAADLAARSPELRGHTTQSYPICIQVVDRLDDAIVHPDTIVHIAIASQGGACRWLYDPARLDPEAADDLQRGFRAMLASAASMPGMAIGHLPLLTVAERDLVLRVWNKGETMLPPCSGIHRAFVDQVAQTPDRIAVTCRGVSLTYSELDARSNRLARYLCGLGVRRGVLVGLYLDRSIDMLVALIAIHKAGGAYVPLDPAYPPERLAHMITDSALKIIVTRQSLAASLPATAARIVQVDRDRARIEATSAAPCDGGARASDLAYVIYTSGSTGLPKGVMVEHRNVLNFFAGMDRKLEPEGVWLAVTSLSFDISVLELCWPLTRGYHVVIATEREVLGAVAPRASARPLGFSLFYFANSDGTANADQYRLLLEGAKFADDNDFEAIWTPERHFHAFGGLYPNPSVASAAIAVTTSRVKIRAGSVVAPLHHPARIAEEWALVDNLSGGRTGIAFASGWQPNDFLLRPENFADRSGALMRCIADVRALWRGERRSFPGPLGDDVEVGVFPRPIQPELPFWITSAGNPDTFAAAGRAGAFVLTHLLGQTIEEVAAKLDVYRSAWREAGHSGEGHVTLMLHSFIGDDVDAVRSIVRGPLIEYLRTSTGLLKQYAWSFPAFKRPAGSDVADQPDLSMLTEAETEALLEHAFDRYFETSGLFGTPDGSLELVEQLRGIGVDEIGCLIDFGIPTEAVLRHLPDLNRLRMLATSAGEDGEMSLPELMAVHGVTHLQCTPSLILMLASDAAAREGLASLRRLMIGGEAFPPQLAAEMTRIVGGAVMNMYGPTETTIWSAVHVLDREEGAPPLGRPLVNQQIYVLDQRQQPVRPGTPGELVIGGEGVVRGYLDRPELTADRFVADPFTGGRMYRTGDLARQRGDGTLEFLGRLDHQVKILGHRIELGEIEAGLLRHADVREAVVVARGTGTDARLVAYCVGADGLGRQTEALRLHLRTILPEYMIPAVIVVLDAMPRTPNGKLDRNRLPDPELAAVEIVPEPEFCLEPVSPLQDQIRTIWREVLKRQHVGLRDNFFDIGGHSLLALQAHRRLSAAIDRPLSLTDLFRFPTVEALSGHLSGAATAAPAREGQERARSRRLALQRRNQPQALVRN